MSVLNLAGSEPSANPGTESSSAVPLGEGITHWLEGFLSGLIPFGFDVKIDWETLDPIVSVLSTASAAILATAGANPLL